MSEPEVLEEPQTGSIVKRLTALKSHFEEKYNRQPVFYVRVPGRVNLIGEHIDYCGYAVFPMAIEQDILVAVAANDQHKLNLTSLENYPDFSTSTDSLKIDQSNPQWYSYFLCGFRGVIEKHLVHETLPMGLDAAVTGTVPPSAGLSSSSALVCAAALATVYASGLHLSKLELANICAHSERYVGTQGGGMDQAIIFLAEKGTARLIEFNPLRPMSVSLPKGATFVIADSGVKLNKAATSHYNTRVVECRLATYVIAKYHDLDWRKYNRLRAVQVATNIALHEMGNVVTKVFHKEPYTRDEVCQILEITEEELEKKILSENTKHLQEFKLYQRALHVYQEASRVWEFKSVCERQDPDCIETLGKLMNESHKSCRDLYECSHPVVDKLVQASLEVGALGARLTGAGWGGCTVSLIHSEQKDGYLKKMKEKLCELNISDAASQNSIFPTFPGSGAVVYCSTQ